MIGNDYMTALKATQSRSEHLKNLSDAVLTVTFIATVITLEYITLTSI